MREVREEILKDFSLGNITKLVLNKTIDGETIIECSIVDTNNASVMLQGVSNSSKGKELKESKFIKGTLIVALDKTNYDTLLEANYEFVQGELIKGNKVEDLYKFLRNENGKYFVEI